MDRRTILQSAGALIGASAFFSARSTFAQAAGPSNARVSPWHKGQVGFMLAHEQFTVPQLVAANGPKAMRRAGQYGDGLITDPKIWKQHKSEFESGAKAAGKESGQMAVLIEQYAVVGDKKDAEAAAKLWRFGPKAFKTYYNILDPHTIQQRAEAEIPLEQVYREWPVSTDADVHVQALTELFHSGATHVNIHSGQADQRRVIDFYGKDVLPRWRSAMARQETSNR
jgi:coenzyme F420-dependent glucose-6-phosphate dehydrogenase